MPELKKLKCLRCGHEWVPNITNPITCPKCKSPYWNKPRKEVKKPKAKSTT